MIKLFSTQDPKKGFNITIGGEGVFKFNLVEADLMYQYIILNKTISQCAHYFGCSRSVIDSRISEYGLKKSKSQVQESYRHLYIDPNILYYLYMEEN